MCGRSGTNNPGANSTPQGLLVVISGPSGVGKTTIAREVEKRCGGEFSVSATTRPKLASDVEGRDYFFLIEEEFRRRVERGLMLEHAQVFGRNWYGTPREPVERALREGRLIILEIDVQGGVQVRERIPGAFMIFIEPPSDQALLDRLRARGRDREDAIQRRFAEARREIEMAHASGAYDLFITNNELDAAIDAVCSAVTKKRS